MRSRESGGSRWTSRTARLAISFVVGSWVLAGLGGASAARAEDEPGVARVSLIEGEASYLRGDADDWTGVAVNAPLVTGDRFYSGADSRAEIQLAPAVYARLSSETEVSMLELGPETTQVRMSLGLASYRVRRDPGQGHVEIDTPGAAVVVRGAGVYRVQVERNGDTDLQVRGGEATVYVAGEQYQIGDGRGVAIEGIGDAARPRIYVVSGEDGWDSWEAQRAGRVENAVSTQYVSEEIYGAEDLDEYGDWQQVPQYGNVWRPRVASGWAPYTDGRWVWVDPWGWTWLDYASWGWAPFHYGRWVFVNNFWGWAPGPIIARPVYAPALVGWFGGGWGGVSVSVGFGSIGWTPLGWGEPCFPWWGGWGGVVVGSPWWGGWGGPRVYNNVVINKNITNINVNNYNFGNLRHRGGFSTVPIGDFRNGRGRITPVGGPGGRGDFRPIGGRVPVTPTRDSLPATNPSRGFGGRSVQTPPGAVEGRNVVTARTPSTRGQPSFERKLPVLERNQGAPLTPATLREMGGEGGRAPRVQTVSNPTVSNPGDTGRQVRTLPSTAAPGGGDASTGDDRAGSQRAGSGRESMTFPSGRTPTDAATGGSGDATRGGGRTIVRPPATAGSGRAMPVAPRDGGADRQPYVARRPAWNDASTTGSGTGTGRAVAPGGGAPRTSASSTVGGQAPGGGRTATAPRSAYPGVASAPSSRSVSPNASAPQARSLPGGSRQTQSVPRSGAAPQGYPPSVRSAPAPDRGGGSRSYLSQPRTATPRTTQGTAPSRGYASPATRSAPSYGSPGAPRSGGSQRATAPQVRSAPAPQVRAPAVQSAPRSAPAMRSMPSAPSGGGSFAQRSAPSGMGRGGFSGAPGGSMSRSAGGSSAGGMGGFGGGRAFGGGGRSGG